MPEPRSIVPEKGLRPGKNTTVAAIPTHSVVALVADGDEDPHEIELPAAGGPIYGVSLQHGVTEAGETGLGVGHIGDIQVEGRAICIAGELLTVGMELAATVEGKLSEATTGDIVVARCMSAAAAEDDLFEAELVGAAQSYIAP